MVLFLLLAQVLAITNPATGLLFIEGAQSGDMLDCLYCCFDQVLLASIALVHMIGVVRIYGCIDCGNAFKVYSAKISFASTHETDLPAR